MQASFYDLKYADNKKLTRRDRFLGQLEVLAPRATLVAAIAPFYSESGRFSPETDQVYPSPITQPSPNAGPRYPVAPYRVFVNIDQRFPSLPAAATERRHQSRGIAINARSRGDISRLESTNLTDGSLKTSHRQRGERIALQVGCCE